MIKKNDSIDVEDIDLRSTIGVRYVSAPGNHMDYKNGNGNGLRVYVPLNANLKPVLQEIRSNANGNGGRVFQDGAGEDVPEEVLYHSKKFIEHDNVNTYGITGSDFALDVLFNPDRRDDTRCPNEYKGFFLFDDSDGTIQYENPSVLFGELGRMRDRQQKLGIVAANGYIFFIDPLAFGKLPDFCVLGPMTERLLDVYDNLLTRNEVEIDREESLKHVERVQAYVASDKLSDDDREYFHSQEFNNKHSLEMRYMGRRLRSTSPEVAAKFFKEAIEPYKGRKSDIFVERRFENLARASTQHSLLPEGIDIDHWEPRTRSIEAAVLRNYTAAETAGGEGAYHKPLVFEIVESHTSAAAKNLESFKSIGKIPAARLKIDKIPAARLKIDKIPA
jgi:hypothetical protein